MRPFASPAVARVFADYPRHVKREMLDLRELILDTAADTPGVGRIEETLKWGEPAYVTVETKSGSTVRIDWKKTQPDRLALYFNCQTTLVETFRSWFPRDFAFEGKRALTFPLGSPAPRDALALCLSAAFTYHLHMGQRRKARP